MTPELRTLRTAFLVFICVWLMQALLVQVMLFNHARQAEALQARLVQVEAKMEGIGK